MKPLAVDLYCGLGGWSDGLLTEGWDVIGFDIERHRYPARALAETDGIKTGAATNRHGTMVFTYANEARLRNAPLTGGWIEYPAQLVIQDVLTLHGSQFRDVDLIVASPPCQFFSYTAMPWTRAKKLAAEVRADPARLEKELALFNACFRIQREACEAAGRHIPLIVENVRGAIPWVGRSQWNFGSYHLWGDVPALMPVTLRAQKFNPDGTAHPPGSWFAVADSQNRGAKNPGFRFDGSGRSFQSESVERHTDGRKVGKDWFGGYGGGFGWDCSPMRRNNSRSPARKAASAMIAKIPEPLSRYIARVYLPQQ